MMSLLMFDLVSPGPESLGQRSCLEDCSVAVLPEPGCDAESPVLHLGQSMCQLRNSPQNNSPKAASPSKIDLARHKSPGSAFATL